LSGVNSIEVNMFFISFLGSQAIKIEHLQVYPFGKHARYSTACMFTEEETRGLYKKQLASLGENKTLPFTFEDLEKWYNGYTTFDRRMLFNPWSIGRALVSEELGPHWVASGYDKIIDQRVLDLLRNETEFRKKIASILEGGTMSFIIDESMSYRTASDMSMSQLWTLIYYTGYLTIVHPENRPLDSPSHGRKIFVRIPNLEVHTVYGGWLRSHLHSSIRAQKLDTQSTSYSKR